MRIFSQDKRSVVLQGEIDTEAAGGIVADLVSRLNQARSQ
jgi:hypothetical protein